MAHGNGAQVIREMAGPMHSQVEGGPIVVASDGKGSALAAIRAARELESITHRPVRLLSVVEPIAQLPVTPDAISYPVAALAESAEALEKRVRREIRAIAGEESAWHVDVDVGDPARAIARAAKEMGASLIVTGFGQHGAADRLLGGETVIDLAEATDTPLLATSAFDQLPQRVLLAIDQEIPGLSSAPPPLALFSAVKSVYCVHVEQRGDRRQASRGAGMGILSLEREVPGRVRSLFGLSEKVLVQGVALEGDASSELLDFAARFRIDLIVVSRRKHNLLQRAFSNGISMRILRRAHCSVLLLPPAEKRADLHTMTSSNPVDWPAILTEVTHRDAGRRVSLEIDDVELGAQSEVREYPLLGVAYDHKDECAELMLGEMHGGGRHITHAVGGVTSVDLLFDANGKDSALRIAYEGGQILLTFLN